MLASRTSPAGFPMAPSAEEWKALSPDKRAELAAVPARGDHEVAAGGALGAGASSNAAQLARLPDEDFLGTLRG